MNREYIISMVIGFVLVFAGALVVYKGSDTKFVKYCRWGTILTNIYYLSHLPCIQWSICAVHNYSIK